MKLPNFSLFKRTFISVVMSPRQIKAIKVNTKTGKVIKFAQIELPVGVIVNYRVKEKELLAKYLRELWDKNKIPLSFALEQNYPNPFNPTTTIRYSLPEKSFVRLEIYNIAGQKIATLVDGEKNAGYYETKFDANNFASGIYFYVLRAGKFTERKKMVLMK